MKTSECYELVPITGRGMGAVQEAGMDEVMCVISSAHTTAGAQLAEAQWSS